MRITQNKKIVNNEMNKNQKYSQKYSFRITIINRQSYFTSFFPKRLENII